MEKTILLTGGTGFIGSHTVVELIEKNYKVIIIDDLSNSKKDVVDKLRQITKSNNIIFYKKNILDKKSLKTIFKKHSIESVIHFAAFKSVSDSVSNPLDYYKNNIGGLINILSMMKKYNVFNLIFSSSATVYGNPKTLPINETSPTFAINPYGQTKLMGEQIIKDLCKSEPKFNAVILRYFNPVGCHKSGLIGDNPEKPNNLFPCILNIIKSKNCLSVFGNDYDTFDGSCIRDYIHVVDLAKGHIKALSYILYNNNVKENISIFNLGTGKGYSVFDIINEFNSQLSKTKQIKYKIKDRRKGDAPSVYADPKLAINKLQWVPTKTLSNMVSDSLISL